MATGAASHSEFIDILVEALEEQEVAARAVVQTVLWQPTTAELAGVRQQSMHPVRQTDAAHGIAARQQMASLRRSQDAVHFYYGRGVVVEQMWLA